MKNSKVKKIIVFAIFKKTIKYLNIRLKKAGYNPVMIYGDSKINKFEVLECFRTDSSIEVLLSSEVGSEGLDMQFCNCLVNYDLPWNPMVVEQRIGRIDRFGQESPKVNIYNIVVMDTIVENITHAAQDIVDGLSESEAIAKYHVTTADLENLRKFNEETLLNIPIFRLGY